MDNDTKRNSINACNGFLCASDHGKLRQARMERRNNGIRKVNSFEFRSKYKQRGWNGDRKLEDGTNLKKKQARFNEYQQEKAEYRYSDNRYLVSALLVLDTTDTHMHCTVCYFLKIGTPINVVNKTPQTKVLITLYR
jgi:hypothetical protein